MSALPCLTNIRPNAPIFQVTAGGGNIPLNQDIVCSTITVGETATVEALLVSSINGQVPGGGGGGVAGVSSISAAGSSLTGEVTFTPGNNVDIAVQGNSILISATGGGGGTGPDIVASTITTSTIVGGGDNGSLAFSGGIVNFNTPIYIAEGNAINFVANGEIANVSSINGEPYVPGGGGGGGVTQINAVSQEFTGAITLIGGTNMSLTSPSANAIQFDVTGGGGVYPPDITVSSIAMPNGGFFSVSPASGGVFFENPSAPNTHVFDIYQNLPLNELWNDGDTSVANAVQVGYYNDTGVSVVVAGSDEKGGLIIATDKTGALSTIQMIADNVKIDALTVSSINGIAGGGTNLVASTITVAETITLLPPSGSGNAIISCGAGPVVNIGGSGQPVNMSTVNAQALNVDTINGVPAKIPRLVNVQYNSSYQQLPAANPTWTTVINWDDTPSVDGTYVINANFACVADPTNFASWYGQIVVGGTVLYQTQVDTDGTNNIFNANMPMVAYFTTTAGYNCQFALQASQAQAIATEAVKQPSWNITFYPS